MSMHCSFDLGRKPARDCVYMHRSEGANQPEIVFVCRHFQIRWIATIFASLKSFF